MSLPQKLFRYIFWTSYLTVLITAFLPVTGSLDKIKLGPGSFQIRLDHLLHLTAYFLICMYYLIGQCKGLTLFNKDSLRKFIILMLLLGTVTEIIQLWIPSRAFNVFDLLANVSGLLIGLVVIRVAEGKSAVGSR